MLKDSKLAGYEMVEQLSRILWGQQCRESGFMSKQLLQINTLESTMEAAWLEFAQMLVQIVTQGYAVHGATAVVVHLLLSQLGPTRSWDG